MTDGILLAEYSGDKNLSKYSCIILDEAHDRTLNTDLLMAFLKAMIQSRRKDLTIVIMSATINAPMFQKYFMDAPLFSVEGRTHPVQIEYLSEVTDSVVNTAACVVLDILKTSSKGDILVFLSGEDEVEGLCAILRRYGDKNLLLMPLYSALSKVEQNNVFKRIEDGARKCVVATNIAEASITIGGIAYVVDSGLMKQTRYDYRIGMSMLQKTTVSKAAANQRAGRAARAQPGKCVRLYTEECYNKFRPSTLPSIHCQDLKSVCLKVLSNCSGSILNFDFIERPPIEGLLCAIRDLQDM
jgi:HrpA-like RNA helicase